jgi:hypothetical protein
MAQEEDNNPLPSRKLRLIRSLGAVNTYGFFFAVGLAAANISRAFPYGGTIYIAVVVSIIGFCLLSDTVDGQKVILLGSFISAIAFWDALVEFITQPIFLGYWILPLWQCLLYLVGFLMMAVGILSVMQPKN